MESQFPCVPLITFLIFFFTIVRILKISSKAKKPNLNKLPPGPWKLPLIGNLHQLFTSFPHHTLRDLSNKYGALMQLQLGEVPTVVISSARVAEQVFKTHDTIFSQRPHVLACEVMSYNCKAIVFTPYGNYWKQMRKICTMELLSPTRVQSFQSIRTEEVTDFIKSIALSEGSAINLSEKIFSLSYGITARATSLNEEKIQELKFLRLIVKETLRLHPPALLILRQSRENCVINGYEIAAKAKVLVNAWAIQRDPFYWKDAEEFYPERFSENSMDFRGKNFEYIPFGAGRRICPGILFGIHGIELPLASLLYHFDWKLPNGMKFEDLEMTESFGLTNVHSSS